MKAGPAGSPRVRVGREVAGRGGKGVSVISGLPFGPAELEDLSTRLKKLCGAGGAVRDGAIEIQGDHRDRLVAELQAPHPRAEDRDHAVTDPAFVAVRERALVALREGSR